MNKIIYYIWNRIVITSYYFTISYIILIILFVIIKIKMWPLESAISPFWWWQTIEGNYKIKSKHIPVSMCILTIIFFFSPFVIIKKEFKKWYSILIEYLLVNTTLTKISIGLCVNKCNCKDLHYKINHIYDLLIQLAHE